MLAHQVINDSGAHAAFLFLHGILGSGANWRTFARRLCAARPGLCGVLCDLRLHGASQEGFSPPHTLAAAADEPVERQNPLLGAEEFQKSASAMSAPRRVSMTAMLVVLAIAIMVAGNLGYWARGRAATIQPDPARGLFVAGHKVAGVPHALLGSDAMPLELRLDRRTDLLGPAIAR